ncbi:MAG: SPOR domain-containing protein [Clostridiales bacterium]|jgi:hypothetical protein|nr:SPOR domain-containing protein [Clostridiales bacterium]
MQLISSDEPQIFRRSNKRTVIRTFRVNKIAAAILAVSALVLTGAIGFALYTGKFMTIGAGRLYCAQFSIHESLAEAQKNAESLKAAGGAGYIVNDGGFRVVGGIYKSREEAQSVVDKQAGGAVLYELHIAKVTRPVIDDKTVAAAVKTGFSLHIRLFDGLYPVMNDLDKGRQSESVLMAAITAAKSDIEVERQKLNGYYEETGRAEIAALCGFFDRASVSLTAAETGTTRTLSSRLKYALAEIAALRARLSEAVAKL